MVVIQVEMQMGQEAHLCLTSGWDTVGNGLHCWTHIIIELDNSFWEEKLKTILTVTILYKVIKEWKVNGYTYKVFILLMCTALLGSLF